MSADKQKLIAQIDEVLPQTQCTRCGYPSCLDYATALANDEADINQCPPGKDQGIVKLAALLNKPVKPLNPEFGLIKPRQVAVIDEDICIGCTLCIKACPVDAILGSNKMMHTVIADECTGCALCLPVCPVDCITMQDADNQDWSKDSANHARKRYYHHNYRKQRDIEEREKRLKQRAGLLNKSQSKISDEDKNNLLLQILNKVRSES